MVGSFREDTRLDDPLNDIVHRWMCSNCGLIFDYHFDWESTRSEGWQDPMTGDVEVEEFCLRCATFFEKKPPMPVTVKNFEPEESFTLTFFVEDTMHKSVVDNIARQLKTEVLVEIAHGRGKVQYSFDFYKSIGALTNRYFIVDGDNKSNPYSEEPNFVQLKRYCIENYLIDFDVCAAISDKSADQIRFDIFSLVKRHRDNLIGTDALAGFLFDRLDKSDFELLLPYVDASKIFPSFMQKIGIGKRQKERFVEKYVDYCHSTSRMKDILPARLVEVIQEGPVS